MSDGRSRLAWERTIRETEAGRNMYKHDQTCIAAQRRQAEGAKSSLEGTWAFEFRSYTNEEELVQRGRPLKHG